MIAYVNNTFIEEEKATLQVGDLALQRGYAAFDYLRTLNSAPLFLDDYMDRFFRSAHAMHLQPQQSKEDLKALIEELNKKNGLSQSGIRMILTGGYSPDSYQPTTPNLVLLQQPLQLPPAEKFNVGVKVITHAYQRELPEVKSTNYLMGIWLQQQVRAHHAADVLYHQNGMVSEFPRANVFIVTKNGKLVTPAQNILKGITRMKLLQLATKDFEVEERAVHIDEVKEAAEVFMTSTTKRLLPISQIDDVPIGTGHVGPVTTQLNQLFIEMENRMAPSQEKVV